MTLTNYWWLLIWLFAGGYLLNRIPKQQEWLEGRRVERWSNKAALLMVVPFMIWTGFRNDVGDTGLYRRIFLEMGTDLAAIPEILFGGGKDPGFTVYQILIKNLIGDNDTLFFLIIGVFQMYMVARMFRRYSSDYWVSIFLFVASTDYISWCMNGMRQFIAVCIIIGGFRYMVEKDYVKMVLLVLLASLFHGSALLMIPVIFVVQGKAWDVKTILMLAATMIIIVYVDQFTPILQDLLMDTNYDDVIDNEIWSQDDGTNIIRVAVYSVPALLSLFGLRYVRQADDPVINICVNCSVVTMALYLVASVTSGIYVGRLPIYTTLMGYIALPWMIGNIFTERSVRLVRWMMIGLYAFFFYYQMHFTWGMI